MRIQTTFDPDFEELYNRYNINDKGKALLDIEGVSRDALDIGVMSKKYFTNKVSDISLDANSNSNDEISHNNYSAEIVKGLSKLNSYYLLHTYAKGRFGLERSNELLKSIFNSSVYFHDAASTQIPYCMAYSTSFIMNEGRKYGQLQSLPPKRASSFMAQVIETTMDLSQNFAGAIAVSDLIVNLCYYTKKENLDNYQIINLLQGFTHVMSNKFRVGGQSPFTNLSIFDRPNLEKLFEHYTYPDGSSIDYEYVISVQKAFAEWFANGDPASGLPYRFPIVTCLSGNTDILICKDKIIIKDSLKNIFGQLNNGWTDIDNLKTFNEHGNLININRIYKQYIEEPLYNIKFDNGIDIQVTSNHKFLTLDGLKTADKLCDSDYISYCNNKFSKHDNYITELFIPDFINNPYIVGAWISNKGKLHEKYNMTRGAFEQLQRRKVFPYKILKDNNICILNTKTKDINDKTKCSIPTHIKVDEEFGYLLGLYIAEGHTSTENVGFSFNITENEYIDFVYDYLNKTLQLKTIKTVHKECNSTQVITYSSTLGKLFTKFCGKGACNKFINNIIYNFHPNVIKMIIKGWIDGDGHINYSEVGNPRIIVTTCSKQLAEDMQTLMKVIGINSFIRKHDNSRGFGEKNNIIYEVKISSDSNSLLDTDNKTFIRGGIFYHTNWIGIKSINLFDYKGFVYDLSVDSEHHLYTLPSGIITHNCNIACREDKSIIDTEFLEWFSKVNCKNGTFNIYVNSGNKIASCCRLVNDKARMEARGDSFGNGGLNLGSHRVVTVNLPRVALKANKSMDRFFTDLTKQLEICRDLLIVHREEILQRRIDQVFLQFFNPMHWFTLKRLFSTIGIIGIHEACYFMGLDIRTEEGTTFATNVLKFIENFAIQSSIDTGNSFNVEEIPGESVASKLVEKDKVLFGPEKIPFELYSNQYIPLILNASLPERIELTGKFQDILSGGGILHLNIQDRITDPTVMKHLIEYSVSKGVSHLAVNYGFGECEQGHVTVCGNADKCSVCGGKVISHMTRIVGYFTKTDSWGPQRREYEFPRRVFS